MTTIAFLGAGSVVFTRQLLVDILGYPELVDVRITLHDIDPERLAVAAATAAHVADRLGAHPVVFASQDRRAVLEGADFVVIIIQVGGLASTRIDFEIPERFGLHQTIADTLGIGGIFRGLRTFPALSAIAADVVEVCPDAWVLNYTNPMAMNVAWWGHTAPSLKVVGLCHSVFWTVNDLCELVGVPIEGTHYRAAGVNHQSWLLEWTRDGRDLYPDLDVLIAGDGELRRRVRVEMYRRLGFYPTETSEHSSEYVSWFLQHPKEIERLRIPVGDYVGISEANVAEYEQTRALLADGKPLVWEDEPAAEYAPQVIHSIVTGTPRLIHANVANDGLIDNLPAGAPVEVPCAVDGSGLQPQAVGALPPQCAALNHAYLDVVALTVAAAAQGRPELVRQAAMVDPNTSASLSLPDIWQLCDELTRAHGELLPEVLRSPGARPAARGLASTR